ncbi:hypothetical protein OO012_18690 [Rhodobacteraceae bacterium KMM 6894]|nr:hypothetical protein [Roseovarius aestuarii]MEB8389258.1 hypothetical protein [Rhodobacteraceae bacterium KMM 6894]
MQILEVLVDALRATHLVLFAAGMGTGLYCDFRMLRMFRDPIGSSEISSLSNVHSWVSLAFCGLWATGVTLIYVRTDFDLSTFSPKLWLKLGIMSILLANSILISRVVLPILDANSGRSLAELSPTNLMIVSQIAITSMFCWTSGLLLGSSVVLRSASWEVLVPLAAGWFLLLSVFGQIVVTIMQRRMHPKIQEHA